MMSIRTCIFVCMCLVAMGAAGRLGVLLFFWCFFFSVFLVSFFDDGVGWGGVGWDVNVHVTFMMLR